MTYNWCRAKLRLPGFNLWPEEKSSGSKRKQMEETAGNRLKDRGELDVGRGGREGSRRECTNDAQDLSRTYGLFRRPLSAQREGSRSIYAKQPASCIIYMHSACTWMRESRYVAMNAPGTRDVSEFTYFLKKDKHGGDYFNIKASIITCRYIWLDI